MAQFNAKITYTFPAKDVKDIPEDLKNSIGTELTATLRRVLENHKKNNQEFFTNASAKGLDTAAEVIKTNCCEKGQAV